MIDFTSIQFTALIPQLLASAGALAFGTLMAILVKKIFNHRRIQSRYFSKLKASAAPLILPLILCITQWTLVAACREFQWDYQLNYAVAKLFTAWLAIRFLSLFHIQPGIKKVVGFFIWGLTFLQIVGLLPHLVEMLEKFSIHFGELHLSLLSILKGGLLFSLLLWGTSKASKWTEQTLRKSGMVDRFHQELLSKLFKVALILFTVLISLSVSGINLSAFALFGGAIGVGIGFGLQKVVSNFICGIILLMDRSIKPGDVIGLDEGKSYGEIVRLGARCVTVRTRSGKEHMIPNESFITHKSENWSLSDDYVRLKLPMRAGLDADVPLVLKLLLEAAEGVDRITFEKKPGARLIAFTESAIEFELRVWIKDPKNGLSKVRSDVYVNIWTLFNKHGITIPHAQTDIHMRTPILSEQSPFDQQKVVPAPVPPK